MRKKWREVGSLVLCGAMMASMLAGCGNNASSSSSSATPSNSLRVFNKSSCGLVSFASESLTYTSQLCTFVLRCGGLTSLYAC